jgi:integrase
MNRESNKKKSNRKRRGRGEGSVFEREDGQWVGSISLGLNEAGKRKRKTVYGATKQEVLDKLDNLRRDARAGNLPDAQGLTVAALLDRWLQSTRSKTAPRTVEERERLIKNHIRPHLGAMRLARLTPLHVEGYYADLEREGAGASTISHAAAALGAALAHAVRLRLIHSNPASSSAVPRPRVPSREMLFLTPEQAKALLEAARGQRSHPLLVLALATGCRQGELLALAWEDIDLQRGMLTVRRSLSRTAEGFVLKEPKTASSRRSIALPDVAVSVLTAHKAQAMQAGLLSAPVFSTRAGGFLSKRYVVRAFRAVVRRANTPPDKINRGGRPRKDAPPRKKEPFEPLRVIPAGLRFHDLRHTVASLLLSQGQSVRAVSQRLGHANPALTLRVYAHCMPGDDAQLAAGLNRVLG